MRIFLQSWNLLRRSGGVSSHPHPRVSPTMQFFRGTGGLSLHFSKKFNLEIENWSKIFKIRQTIGICPGSAKTNKDFDYSHGFQQVSQNSSHFFKIATLKEVFPVSMKLAVQRDDLE